MKPILLLFLLSGCSTREVVRVERVEVPVKFIERHIYLVPTPPHLEPETAPMWAMDNCL